MDCAATQLVVCCCSRLQACALRQAHTRQNTDGLISDQTATAGPGTQSGSQGNSAPSNSAVEASGASRLVRRQQQHTATGLQQLPPASASLSDVSEAFSVGTEAAAVLAALHPPPLVKQQRILHHPYSHFFSGLSLSSTPVNIATALCTDIEAFEYARGSCPIQVAFVSHPDDWDIKEYVLQHPLCSSSSSSRQAVQASGSEGSPTQAAGPYQATLNISGAGRLFLTGIPGKCIQQAMGCGATPPAVVLQERVRPCIRQRQL
jgi:hypothetical protein